MNKIMPICIGVDCDDVLSETKNELLKRPELVSKGITRDDMVVCYMKDIKKLGINSDEALQIFNSYLESPEYWQTEPVSGAYEKLYELKEEGHTLFVVTARNESYERQTKERVETHFPGIFSDFLFMNQHSDNEIPKFQLCKEKGVQLLIDDNADNIQGMNLIGMPGFLLDKPWNQGVEDSNLLKRVYSRDEIDISRFF